MGVRPRPRLFIPTTDVRRGGAAVRAFAMSVLRAGAALALLALLGCAAAQRVLLRDVESLVFEAGKMTAGRRTAPVPQMAQTGGRAMPLRGIFCRNVGWDGQSVHWECRLPDDAPARLGKFAIQCEGYDYAGDPYHLAGSCGIEYELLPPAAYASGERPRAPDAPGWVAGLAAWIAKVVSKMLVAGAIFGFAMCLFRIGASKPAPAPVANLIDMDAPPASSRGSDDESSDVDYDSLPSSRDSTPPRRRRRAAAPRVYVQAPPAPAPAPIVVQQPARASVADAFADLAAINLMASALSPRTVVVQQPAPRPAPVVVQQAAPAPIVVQQAAPAPAVSYGKSSTTRETSYEPAVEYGKPAGPSTAGALSDSWSSSSSTGKSSTR